LASDSTGSRLIRGSHWLFLIHLVESNDWVSQTPDTYRCLDSFLVGRYIPTVPYGTYYTCMARYVRQ
jgi:hypothetical protein